MKKTGNYQLNLWEKSDRIQMEDFNADNAKLDAALGAEASAREQAVAAEASARKTADTAEANTRAAADTALGQRIDALAPYAGAQFIRTVTLETSGNIVTLNLGDIDWNQWKTVYLSLDLYMAGSANASLTICGQTMCTISGNATPPDSSADRKLTHMVLYPLFDSRHAVCPLVMGLGANSFVYVNKPYSSLDSISIRNPNVQILAGTKCDIWGEK